MKFGKFTIYFLKETVTRKIHKLIFDVPRFLAKHKTLGYLSDKESESLHCLVNKQLWHYQNIRDQSEKLQLVVTKEELLSTTDRSLAFVTPRPKCDPCNVFLKMGTCPQWKEAVNNPGLFKRFSMQVWQKARINTVKHAMMCNVYFLFSKTL